MVDRSELLVDTSNGHTLPQFNILQFLLFETLSFLTFLYIYVLVLLFSRWPLSKSSFQTRFSTQFHKAKLQHSPQFIYSPSGTSLTTMTLATTFTDKPPSLAYIYLLNFEFIFSAPMENLLLHILQMPQTQQSEHLIYLNIVSLLLFSFPVNSHQSPSPEIYLLIPQQSWI